MSANAVPFTSPRALLLCTLPCMPSRRLQLSPTCQFPSSLKSLTASTQHLLHWFLFLYAPPKCGCDPECHHLALLLFRISTLKNCIHFYVFNFNYFLHFDNSPIYSASLDFSPDFPSNYPRNRSNQHIQNEIYHLPLLSPKLTFPYWFLSPVNRTTCPNQKFGGSSNSLFRSSLNPTLSSVSSTSNISHSYFLFSITTDISLI